MTEYMLYLSHNTISYHFDITQMLISSTIFSLFNIFPFSQINLLLHINFYIAFICWWYCSKERKLLFYLVEVVFMSFTVYAFLRLFLCDTSLTCCCTQFPPFIIKNIS